MAFRREKPKGKRPQGVSKAKTQTSRRRSARLNPNTIEHIESKSSSPTSQAPCQETRLSASSTRDRKRSSEVEDPIEDALIPPFRKRPRKSVGPVIATQTDQEAPFYGTSTQIDPIDYWRKEQTWPKEYFEPDTMSHLLARKKSTPSLRRKRSGSGSLAASSTTPSDQKPREEKSAPYQDPRYRALLETKGSYMDKSELDITDASKVLCRTLLEREQAVPKDSLFRDDVFDKACRKLQDKNEARVVQDIARLIVPSAETLATFGAKPLEVLTESVNEGWNNSMPLTGTRPQPDYSVGFKRTAFTEDQLNKLSPFISDFITSDQSFFMATYYMYFPFLTCEVKCGSAALDIADRQNAHSMTLAVRAIVELFRLAKREQEVHRQILAFSISHDHQTVRIYGHYPVVDGSKITFYRHPIRKFDFTELEGKEKWTAYKFTKNVYDTWMPTHLDRICSIIDELPFEIDFEVPPLQSESGLSQGLESNHLSQSFSEVESLPGVRSGQSSTVDAGAPTPDTSFTERGASKKSKRGTASSKC